MNHLEKRILLEVPNSDYWQLQHEHAHLKDLKIHDQDSKDALQIHVILGVTDYTKIKVQERSKVGLNRDPIAELTELG